MSASETDVRIEPVKMNQPQPIGPSSGLPPQGPLPPSQKAFNIPAVVAVLAGLMLVVHLIRTEFLSADANYEILVLFGFWPARYSAELFGAGLVPGGYAADVWSFLTYAFLHGSWAHVGMNMAWMIAFAPPLAVRLGTVRFLALSAVAAIAGVLVHLALHFGEAVPVIGASAAVSGQMAAVFRFAFQPGGPMAGGNRNDPRAYELPVAPLRDALLNARVRNLLILWFGINLLFGVAGGELLGASGDIAWEAHVGGFLAGFLLFPYFDPVRWFR
ncbi:hypothetical protein APZ00_16340 [Pannonibacter phragmitetus]|uniref:Peptidase S54 rhomboid domain-containing protein n=2 Tax=Stappiaceae TaxID=2821832 RepID=A0A0U3N6B0_9HYPH|nr:hypothetical protein APZ00_16340 [Pannonibacter phragmitetus]